MQQDADQGDGAAHQGDTQAQKYDAASAFNGYGLSNRVGMTGGKTGTTHEISLQNDCRKRHPEMIIRS